MTKTILITAQEACKLLGVCPQTLRDMDLPSVLVGKRRKYIRADLEDYLRQQAKRQGDEQND